MFLETLYIRRHGHCDYMCSCSDPLIDGLLAGLVVQGQRMEIEGSSLEITAAALQ